MFILIMVIILGTCVSVLSSIYYNTIALQKTYGSVNTYYGAYYGAMSSIERWLLMTKIKYPGYEWEWWFKWNSIIWAKSNGFSGDFWRLSHSNNTMTRSIKSKTDHIVWSIDNKTLRYITFHRYEEYPGANNDYRRAINHSGVHWLTDWLSFSWTVFVKNTNTINNPDKMIDFNRFFGMKNSGYTVRWLLDTQSKFNNNTERQYPLSGNFNFLWDKNGNGSPFSHNPRPTITWTRSMGEKP